MALWISLIKPIAYLSVPIVLLRTITSSSPTVRYYVNVGIYLGAMVLVSVWGAAVGVGMFVARQPFELNFYVARTFYAVTGRLLSIQVDVQGGEYLDTRPAVFMANHQSMLDVLVLGRVFPIKTSIMAKKELRWTPLGPFMRLAGALFVDRGNSASAIQSMAEAGETMKKKKTSLWIFPEGTRSSSEVPSMLPLKKGGFHLAVQAGIPIVPVVTENYWWLYHSGVFGHGTMKVQVLPPVPTTGLTVADVPALAIRVHDQMLDTLRNISIKVSAAVPEEEKAEESSQFAAQVEVPPVVDPASANERVCDGGAVGGDVDTAPSSLAGSVHSSRRNEGSENGTETEEDEGMVLVGRP